MIGAAPRHRIACSVPGCPRAVTVPPIETFVGMVMATEGVCAVHWRLVPLSYRQVYRRATRAIATDCSNDHRGYNAFHRLWRRCVRAAIERSMGL